MQAHERSNAELWTQWWRPWALPLGPWQAAWDYWVDAAPPPLFSW